MNKTRKNSNGKNFVGKLERIDLKDYTVIEPATRDEIKQMLKKILKSKNSVKDIEKIMKNQHDHLYESEIRKISINQNIGIDKRMENIKNNYILKEIGERLLNLKSNERIIFETNIKPDILEKIRKCQLEIALENFDVKSTSKSKSQTSSLSISKIKNPKLNSKTRSKTEDLKIIKELVNGTDKVPIITTNPFTSSVSSKKSTSSLMDFDFENDYFDDEPKNKKRKRKTGGNLTRRQNKTKRRRTSVRRR